MNKENGSLRYVTEEDLTLLEEDPEAFWKDVRWIEVDAFYNCSSLKSITIPNTVIWIGMDAFYGCTGLERIEVDKDNPRYKSEGNCLLTKDGRTLLAGCKNSVIPDGVTTIELNAFHGCTGLTNIIIPDSVTEIKRGAFDVCGSLESITIPDSVTKIGKRAFRACSSLKSISIPNGLSSIGAEVFHRCSSLESITIPDGVTYVDSWTFGGCSSLKSIIIPDGVTEIGNYAFYGCSGLESITIPDSVTSIGMSAFEGCGSLKSITIPDGVSSIRADVLHGCSSLKSITIPDGVPSIGWGAFHDCSSLESIIIPKSVTKVEDFAFYDCEGLKEITLGCEDGNHKIKADDNILKCLLRDIGALRDFVSARDRHNKTFLPAPQVILNTPKDMVENFYSYSKNWGKLLSEFAESVEKSPIDILYEPKADFYKLCLISGVFSNDAKERDEAMKFVEDKIIGKFNEGELHERFTGLDTKENGYNPEYAKFLRLNFDDKFMIKNIEGAEISYFASSYNRFKEVQKAYPNREVVTNTDNDRLTPELVEKYLQDNKYSNVTEETKELADLCSIYGYSQGEFEVVSDWFLQGKKVKEEGKQQLFCCPDKETHEDVVTYEFLEKDNPLGAVLGDITNCCQKVGDAGESCCRHGMTGPNGGFVVFKKGGKIVGQSWVWYNEEMGKVCLDNVEVPRSAKSSVMHKSAGFIDCLRRLKDGFVEGMKEQNKDVSYVTMGEGYNDILDIARDKFAPVYDKVSPVLASAAIQSASQKVLARGGAPTGVYTDTREGERWIK